MRTCTILFAALIVAMPAAAQRHLDGHRLRSDTQPTAVFTFDSTLTYLGTQSFILYDVARAEQHFFGELDGKRIKRFVWIQFEGYLPDNAHTYDYSRFPTVAVSGRPFHHMKRSAAARARRGRDRTARGWWSFSKLATTRWGRTCCFSDWCGCWISRHATR